MASGTAVGVKRYLANELVKEPCLRLYALLRRNRQDAKVLNDEIGDLLLLVISFCLLALEFS